MADPTWHFMPHGHCYLWEPSLVYTEVITNTLIAFAYVAIAAALGRIVSKIEDLPFERMYLAFGVFILSCGFTHFFDVVTIWEPVYWIDAAIRAVTAVASVGTAVLLFPLVPKAIALADAAAVAHRRGLELEQVNRELAEMTERTKREYHRVVAESLPQKVWVVGADGAIEYVNQRWIDYTGQTLEATQKEGWAATIHPEDREAALERWRDSFAGGEPYNAEFRARRQDGQYRWHIARARPVREEGRSQRWVGTSTDVDDERRASEERAALVRELREAVRTRDEFLSVASHELRTPVTTILLQADSVARLARERLPELVDRCATMARQADRLDKLVGTLLEVSRIATGRLALEPEETDLAAVVREVAAEVCGRAPAGQPFHIEAEASVPRDMGPAATRADRDQPHRKRGEVRPGQARFGLRARAGRERYYRSPGQRHRHRTRRPRANLRQVRTSGLRAALRRAGFGSLDHS